MAALAATAINCHRFEKLECAPSLSLFPFLWLPSPWVDISSHFSRCAYMSGSNWVNSSDATDPVEGHQTIVISTDLAQVHVIQRPIAENAAIARHLIESNRENEQERVGLR